MQHIELMVSMEISRYLCWEEAEQEDEGIMFSIVAYQTILFSKQRVLIEGQLW